MEPDGLLTEPGDLLTGSGGLLAASGGLPTESRCLLTEPGGLLTERSVLFVAPGESPRRAQRPALPAEREAKRRAAWETPGVRAQMGTSKAGACGPRDQGPGRCTAYPCGWRMGSPSPDAALLPQEFKK